MQALLASKYSKIHHQRQIKDNVKKKLLKTARKGKLFTVFQVQVPVYWTYRRTTFAAVLQTALRYQKQAKQ